MVCHPDSSVGIGDRLHQVCDSVDSDDRRLLLNYFGKLSVAKSADVIREVLGDLRRAFTVCIDAHLTACLSASPDKPKEVRDLLLCDDLGAEPLEIMEMIQPDTPTEMIAPIVDLLALVKAMEVFEDECRNGGAKRIRRTATNASLAIANYDRQMAQDEEQMEPTEAIDTLPVIDPKKVEQTHFRAISGFKDAESALGILQYLNRQDARCMVEESPLLISRALYILSTVTVDEQTQQDHASCVEWLCAAGQGTANSFMPIATSNSMLGLAKMPYPVNGQSNSFVLSLIQGTVLKSEQLDSFTIRTSLWSLTRIRYAPEEIREYVEYACQQGVNCIGEFHCTQTIYNCISSLAKIGISSTPVYTFVEALCLRSSQLLTQERNTFNTQELSGSISGLINLGIKGEAASLFIRQAVQELNNRMEAAEPRHLAGTMHSLAKRSMRNGDGQVRCWGETKDFFSDICARASVGSMNARDMTNSLWALATMGHSFTDVFAEDMNIFVRALCSEAATRITQSEYSSEEFQPQEISICLWSLAHLGVEGTEVQQFIDATYAYGEQNIGKFSEQNANNSCWGLAVLSDKNAIPEQGKVFLDKATEMLDEERPESVRQLYHAGLALTRSSNLSLYYLVRQLDFREMFGNGMHTGTTEDELVHWLREGTDAPRFLSNIPFSGFQLDILSDDTKVDVEIDGPHHEDCREIDAFRDRLLRALGIEVIRVPEEMVTHVRNDIRKTLLDHQESVQMQV